MKARLCLLGLAAVVAACDVRLDPELGGFTYTEASQTEMIGDTVAATPLLSQFAVHGEITTPSQCYSLLADLNARGRDLTLLVTARRGNNTCAPDGAFRYQGLITNLDAATYNLKVIHRFSDSEKPEREFRSTLVVQ